MKDRVLQINEKAQHLLAEIFSKEIEIPMDLFISVTDVDCESNLKTAVVSVSVLPFSRAEEGFAYLIKRKGLIQNLFGKRFNMKFTPILTYKLDETGETTDKIYRLIDSL